MNTIPCYLQELQIYAPPPESTPEEQGSPMYVILVVSPGNTTWPQPDDFQGKITFYNTLKQGYFYGKSGLVFIEPR